MMNSEQQRHQPEDMEAAGSADTTTLGKELRAAYDAAKALQDPKMQSMALLDIVHAAAEAGNFSAGREVAAEIPDQFTRARAFQSLAEAGDQDALELSREAMRVLKGRIADKDGPLKLEGADGVGYSSGDE